MDAVLQRSAVRGVSQGVMSVPKAYFLCSPSEAVVHVASKLSLARALTHNRTLKVDISQTSSVFWVVVQEFNLRYIYIVNNTEWFLDYVNLV